MRVNARTRKSHGGAPPYSQPHSQLYLKYNAQMYAVSKRKWDVMVGAVVGVCADDNARTVPIHAFSCWCNCRYSRQAAKPAAVTAPRKRITSRVVRECTASAGSWADYNGTVMLVVCYVCHSCRLPKNAVGTLTALTVGNHAKRRQAGPLQLESPAAGSAAFTGGW